MEGLVTPRNDIPPLGILLDLVTGHIDHLLNAIKGEGNQSTITNTDHRLRDTQGQGQAQRKGGAFAQL